jgi:hypothetical protein
MAVRNMVITTKRNAPTKMSFTLILLSAVNSLHLLSIDKLLARIFKPMSTARGNAMTLRIRNVQENWPRIIEKTMAFTTPPQIPPIIAFLYSFRIYFTSFPPPIYYIPMKL